MIVTSLKPREITLQLTDNEIVNIQELLHTLFRERDTNTAIAVNALHREFVERY